MSTPVHVVDMTDEQLASEAERRAEQGERALLTFPRLRVPRKTR